jgi:hypothetical protein
MLSKINYKAILYLFWVTLFSHVLLLLNNGIMWDSLQFVNSYTQHDTATLSLSIFNTGRRLVYYLGLLFINTPFNIWVLKIICFFVIWIISILVYSVFDWFTNSNFIICFFAAALSICSPINTIAQEPACIFMFICMLLFFLGLFIYLKVYLSNSIPKKITGFIIASILFFWSFEIQSFFVFIYAVTFALFIQSLNSTIKKEELRKHLFLKLIEFCKLNWLLIIVPIVSFWLWGKLFPINGMAKLSGYNQISFSVTNLMYHFGFSCYKIFVMLPMLLCKLAYYNPITTIISLLFSGVTAYLFFAKISKSNSETDAQIQAKPFTFWIISLVALVFFVAALLPYNLVGKDYGALNRNCRNGLLAGFGIVIFLVFSIQHFISNHRNRNILYSILFMLMATGSNLSYMYWQNYFIRFQKTEQLFSTNIKNFKSDYLIIKEQVNNPMHQYFVFYEYNYMCKEACGTEKYLALDEHSKWAEKVDTFLANSTTYRKIFMFNQFNNKIDSEVHITLVSAPNELFTAEKNVWHYWMNSCNAADYNLKMVIN